MRYRILPASYIAILCLMFLLQNIWAARNIFYFVALPVGLFLIGSLALRLVKTSVLLWSVFLFFAVVGINSIGTPEFRPDLLLRHARDSALILAFLVITAYLVWESPRFLSNLMLAIATAAALNALANIYLFYAPMTIVPGFQVTRLQGVAGISGYHNSNILGAMYAVALIGSLGALTTATLSRLGRLVAGLTSVILVSALLLTQSRGSILAVLASLLVLMLGRGSWRAAAAIVGGLLIGYAALAAISADMGFIAARGDSFRHELWTRYLEMAAERPWTGYGLWFDTTLTLSSGMTILNPHNIVLAAQIRGGALAALAMVVLLAAAFYWGLRGRIRGRSPVPLCLIVVAIVAGSLDYDVVSTGLGWQWLLLWFPVGCCIGMEAVLRVPSPAEPAWQADWLGAKVGLQAGEG